jgi:hypothetical protein
VLNGDDPEAQAAIKKFQPDRLLVRENVGFDPAAFNAAFKMWSEYDWYFFMHDDHWIGRPDWWQAIEPLLAEQPACYGNLHVAACWWRTPELGASVLHVLGHEPPYMFESATFLYPYLGDHLFDNPAFATAIRQRLQKCEEWITARGGTFFGAPHIFKCIGGLAGLFPRLLLCYLDVIGGIPSAPTLNKHEAMQAEYAFGLALEDSGFDLRALPYGYEGLLHHHIGMFESMKQRPDHSWLPEEWEQAKKIARLFYPGRQL